MMQFDGIARPQMVSLVAELTFPGIMATSARIERVEKFAGASVGSAVVCFPILPAQRALIGFGKSASINVGGTMIFRGTVGTAPICVSSGKDQVECVLYDDKWGMQRMIVGQSGIGSANKLEGDDLGFPDVGFEIIFNKDGLPNKDPSKLDFKTGSGAKYWTLKQILQFVFAWYVDPTVATLGANDLDAGFNRIPSHVALVGSDGASAVDTVCKIAGRSWGLTAHSSASKFTLVKPGGNTRRTIYFFNPMSGRVVTEAGEWHAGEASISGSILHARDVHQARSARIVKETSIQSKGDHPLLKQSSFNNGKFVVRFESDVTTYKTNHLGSDLSDGSAAKPWLSNLVTRMGVGRYQTADEINEGVGINHPRAEIPVWVSSDGTPEKLRIAHGGYAIDYEKGLIDFEQSVDFLKAGGTTEKVKIDWSKAGVVMTVAVILEMPQFAESDAGSTYLPKHFTVLIDKPDLVPERRESSRLPDLGSTNPDAAVTLATDGEEKYFDVTDRLQDVVDASLASMPKIETPISVELPLFPLCEIGDALVINGRDLGATGDEVIISIRYAIAEQFRTSIEASNVTAAIDPARFIRR